MKQKTQKEWKCSNCDTIIIEANLLEAPNPFCEGETIWGCPHCLSCSGTTNFEEICDEPGCYRVATCGFPVGDKYRRTCGEHYRARDKEYA